MNGYESTKAYWEQVFEKPRTDDPYEPLPYPAIEVGLSWLSQDRARVLDFGSGSGRVLLRCLALGAGSAVGIDITQSGVSLGRSIAGRSGLIGRAVFHTGGVERLAELESASFDGAILFNILDNLLPTDAQTVVAEMHRLLIPGGRLLLKLNRYHPPDLLEEEQGCIALGDGVYQEPSGLFFWNLSEPRLLELMQENFSLEHQVEVPFPEYHTSNRMYYFFHP